MVSSSGRGQADAEDEAQGAAADREQLPAGGRSGFGIGEHPGDEHQPGTDRGDVGGVEVGGPAQGDDQDGHDRPPARPRPLADQAQQREGDEAVEPHRVVGGQHHRPAAQRVGRAEQAGRPPAAGAQREQQAGHRRGGGHRLQDGDDVHREVDPVAGEHADEQGEGAGDVRAQVRQEAGAVSGLPVEQDAAVGPAVQQVPQVGVERHELVAQVVHVARAEPERVLPRDRVARAEGDRRDAGREKGRSQPLDGAGGKSFLCHCFPRCP